MTKKPEIFRFDVPGTIAPPRWIGRLVRLGFGVGALYWVRQLVVFGDAAALSNLWVIGLTAFALQLLPYVVNIGLGIGLGFWRRLTALALIGGAAIFGYATAQTLVSDTLWFVVFGLNIYVYGHLGASFVASALFATPGCEMRAIPILLGKLFGRPVRDHYCPGVIGKIDQWEARRGHEQD